MESFPHLVTKQLNLRRLQLADLPRLVLFANNPKISDQILNIPYPYFEDDAINRLNLVIEGFKSKARFIFCIALKTDNQLVGEIGLHLNKDQNNAQLGYWIAEKFWGQGLATEATGAVLKFGFEVLNLQKIYATHYPNNPASAMVITRNGMIKEAELKDHYKVNDEYRSIIQYRLTHEEYLLSK